MYCNETSTSSRLVLFCSLHAVTLSVIYYSTHTRKNVIPMSIEILTTHIGPGPEYAGGINDFWFRALNISSLFQSGFPFVVKKETEKNNNVYQHHTQIYQSCCNIK